jgi:hypothetical protein
MVRDLMLEAVELRFGTTKAPHAVEWLSDNGSAHPGHRNRVNSVFDKPSRSWNSFPRPPSRPGLSIAVAIARCVAFVTACEMGR